MHSLDQPRQFIKRGTVRNIDAGGFLEAFFISAVASLLAIRFYLRLTGFPQVGGNGLHIAHLLWGGFGMLVSIILLLSLLGRHAKRLAAVIGGIGFGAFIDELGKFITSNNNYFFQPAIAIIYIVFVVLFLCFRAIERRQDLSQEGYLANAIDLIKEGVLHDLDKRERERALWLLGKAPSGDPIVQTLRELLHEVDQVREAQPGLLLRAIQHARAFYLATLQAAWFSRLIILAFVVYAAANLVSVGNTLLLTPHAIPRSARSIVEWSDLLASAASSVMVVLGAMRLPVSRIAAYRWFRRAVLISIFLLQFFSFYSQQLAALVGLTRDVILLQVLDFMIGEERTLTREEARRAARENGGD